MQSKALFLLVLLSFFLIQSCTEPKVEQGEVTYELTYPYMEVDGLLSVVLPDEMTITFKGTKLKTTIKRGRFFETHIISDESNNYLAMYTVIDDKHLYCELTADEIASLKESLPDYACTSTNEQDSIAGVFCTKYTVESKDSLPTFDAWFTDNFTVQNGAWFSSYDEVKGFPMVYDIERYGIFTHAEATSFNELEVNDSTFIIEGDYQKVDFKTYEKESKDVFDILVNW